MLVDADNLGATRLQPVLDLLARLPETAVQLTGSGRRAALRRVRWPAGAQLLEHSGWQRADLALAQEYLPDTEPLLLVTGDGDFALLAARHPGPVLVVSGTASGRLREHAPVVDPAVDGIAPIASWLAALGIVVPAAP